MNDLSEHICEFMITHKSIRKIVETELISRGIKKTTIISLYNTMIASSIPYKDLAIIARVINEVCGETVFFDVDSDIELCESSVLVCKEVDDLQSFYSTRINSVVFKRLLSDGIVYTSFPYGKVNLQKATASSCLKLTPIILAYKKDTDVVLKNNILYIRDKVFLPFDSAKSLSSLLRAGTNFDVPVFISIMSNFLKSQYQYFTDEDTVSQVVEDLNKFCKCNIVELFGIKLRDIITALRESNKNYEDTVSLIANNLLLIKERYNLDYSKQIFAKSKNDIVTNVMNHNFERWNE